MVQKWSIDSRVKETGKAISHCIPMDDISIILPMIYVCTFLEKNGWSLSYIYCEQITVELVGGGNGMKQN